MAIKKLSRLFNTVGMIIYCLKPRSNGYFLANNGQFDHCVQITLKALLEEGYHFDYSIVVSRIGEKALCGIQEKTFLPNSIELSLPKFAISKRNQWLINNSNAMGLSR